MGNVKTKLRNNTKHLVRVLLKRNNPMICFQYFDNYKKV